MMWLKDEIEKYKNHPEFILEGKRIDVGELSNGKMKDVIKLLILLIPVIKDLVSSADSEISTGKKKRILKIMENQDLTKLEKLERILFRKSKVKVEILGFVKGGKLTTAEHVTRGVVVNERLIEHYYFVVSKRGLDGRT